MYLQHIINKRLFGDTQHAIKQHNVLNSFKYRHITKMRAKVLYILKTAKLLKFLQDIKYDR